MGNKPCSFCATGFDTKSGQWSFIFCFIARKRFAVGLAEGHRMTLVIHSSRTVASWDQPWNLNLLTGNNDIVVEGSHLLPKTLRGSLFQTMFTAVVSFPFAHHDAFLAHKDEKDHAICHLSCPNNKHFGNSDFIQRRIWKKQISSVYLSSDKMAVKLLFMWNETYWQLDPYSNLSNLCSSTWELDWGSLFLQRLRGCGDIVCDRPWGQNTIRDLRAV